MGWKGEGFGLGKWQQGITKPIEYDMNKCRLGLGCQMNDGYDEEMNLMNNNNQTTTTSTINPTNTTSTKPKKSTINLIMDQFYENRKNNSNKFLIRRNFINNIVNLLSNFACSETDEDLVFDKNILQEERKLIHREGHRLGLKTQSHGSGENRFLVVKKKKTSKEIFESLVKNGGQSSNYSLISGVNDKK